MRANRPRRPAPDKSAKETILDAAEHVFAGHGFDGTTMRLIAERAGVAQALLHYHFKTKEALYGSLFERRSSKINSSREDFLDDLLGRKKSPALEDVLRVMLMPAAAAGANQSGDYEMFQQIVSPLSFATDARSRKLMVRHYDPIARRFIAEFRRAVPGLSEDAAVWAYLFALGARQQAQARTDRARRLSKIKSKNASAAEAFLVPFIAAGIRAVTPQSARSRKV
jgi:AcrR family transcriptional regulator